MRIFGKIRTILFILSGVFTTTVAAAVGLPREFTQELKRADIPNEAVGVYVQEVSSQKILLTANAALPFNPASTMKLVTTNAALELLGPTFTWKTQAYTNGKLSGAVLQGDLIFKGSGDPKLVIENFWLFLRQIQNKGIREIRGNVVLDRSAFTEILYDPAKFDGDPLRAYNAGPDALLLNYKAFRFQFSPDEAADKVHMTVEPSVPGLSIAVPKLTKAECGEWKDKLQASISDSSVNFGGTFAASCGDKTWFIHPYQMSQTQYFGRVFRQLWSELGGVFTGEVIPGVVPNNANLVTQWESAPLAEVIRDVNKYSNNVMARQVFLSLASVLSAQPATIALGETSIRNWLAQKGIDDAELVLENGAGLSRRERISPTTMGKILGAAFRSPTMPEFISSLPLAGYDGTMQQRVQNRSVAGHAHIKTGSLNEVRAIAGFVLAASGKRYVVICFINHPNASRGVAAQDVLLQWVYDRG